MQSRLVLMARYVTGCVFLGVSAVQLLGCAARTPPIPAAPQKAVALPDQPQLPFSVSVAQELNDGARVFVKVRIEAHTRWSTADSVVVLSGFRNGTKVGEQRAALTVLGPVLEQGSHHEIPIVLTAFNITDYQIELLWGRDSHDLLVQRSSASTAAAPHAPLLEVRNVSVHSERVNCTELQACQLQFAISAELRNSSEKKISRTVLGTGFIWVDSPTLDLSNRIPENEATLELEGLDLGPGASRKIRVVLDRTVPERPDGAFQPVLRVISSSP